MAGRRKGDKTPRKSYQIKILVTEEVRKFASFYIAEGKSFNDFANRILMRTKEFDKFQKAERLKMQNLGSQNEAKKD